MDLIDGILNVMNDQKVNSAIECLFQSNIMRSVDLFPIDLFLIATTDKIEQSTKLLNNLRGKCPFFPTMVQYLKSTFSNIPVPLQVVNEHLYHP